MCYVLCAMTVPTAKGYQSFLCYWRPNASLYEISSVIRNWDYYFISGKVLVNFGSQNYTIADSDLVLV